jgi:hypothetical protein
MSGALLVGGSPVGVEVGGWRERDPYPGEAPDGVDSRPRSAVTDARKHRRIVDFRSVTMSRTDAVSLRNSLRALPVTLSGDLPGEERTAVANQLAIESWDGDPVNQASVTCQFWFDPLDDEE